MTGFEAPTHAEIQALDHIAAHRWAETRNLDPDALSWLVSRGLVEVRGEWALLTDAGWELYEVQGIEATS